LGREFSDLTLYGMVLCQTPFDGFGEGVTQYFNIPVSDLLNRSSLSYFLT